MKTPLSAKLMGHARVVVPLLGVYLALSASVSPSNLVLGLLVSVAVSALVSPPPWRAGPRRLLASAWGAFVYVALLVIDVIKCGINVAIVILRPSLPIHPGVVAIPSASSSDAVRAVSAHGITITPGEMVVEIGDDGTLYTHCLDAPASGATAAAAQADRARRLETILSGNTSDRETPA